MKQMASVFTEALLECFASCRFLISAASEGDLMTSMAHQHKVESFSQASLTVYKAISVLSILATVLYIRSRYAVRAVSRFPLIGQNLGGFSKRRKYFADHALGLFLEGYRKVLLNVERHRSILLILLSSKTRCGVSLHPTVTRMMIFVAYWYIYIPQVKCWCFLSVSSRNFVINQRMSSVAMQPMKWSAYPTHSDSFSFS